jgi:hypothetical protein
LKGTETPDPTSSNQFVLVDETTQHVAPSSPSLLGRTSEGLRPLPRRPQVETSVRPGLVVVSRVGPERLLQVTTSEHQHPSAWSLAVSSSTSPLVFAVWSGIDAGVLTGLRELPIDELATATHGAA